jgi:hypothetical protein
MDGIFCNSFQIIDQHIHEIYLLDSYKVPSNNKFFQLSMPKLLQSINQQLFIKERN